MKQSKRTVFRTLVVVFYTLSVILSIAGQDTAWANDIVPGGINYAYSTWVGSGYYSVGDRRVYSLRGLRVF